MASFKAKFLVLQEIFAKNHRGRGPLGPPHAAGRGIVEPFNGMEIHMEMALEWKWMEMGHN